MSTRNNLKSRSLQRSIERSNQAMQPYQGLMETGDGLMALMMVSGVAQLVAVGRESPKTLASTIKSAAAKSGIPEEVRGPSPPLINGWMKSLKKIGNE